MNQSQIDNPYGAPKAALGTGESAEEFAAVKFWGASGRIRRAYYLFYGTVVPWLILIGIGMVAGIISVIFVALGLASVGGILVILLVAVGYLGFVVLHCMSGLRRLHDINASGWLLLLLILPLVNLVLLIALLFVPGTKGENKFGPRPQPAPTLIKVVAIGGFGLIFVVTFGILAAIALPAYKDYTVRAKMSEVLLDAASCRMYVAEEYASGNTTAPTADGFGCGETSSQSSKYVAEKHADSNGRITVTMTGIDRDVNGKTITLTPLDASGAPMQWKSGQSQNVIEWRCAPGEGLPPKYLPASCRG